MAKKKTSTLYSLRSFGMLAVVIAGLLSIGTLVKLTGSERIRLGGAKNLPVECQLYATQDSKDKDSQFFMIDIRSGGTTDIGPLHLGMDYEDMDFDPQTQELYTVSGRLSNAPGRLFKVDPITGFTTLVGDTGLHTGIPSLSFRATDNSLWGWANEKGLYKINPTTAEVELVKANPSKSVVGLAWTLDGNTLYFTTTDEDLWKMEFPSMTEVKITDNFLPRRAEALEMRPDGYLMTAYHNDQELLIRAYDPVQKAFIREAGFQTDYDDIEGLAWPESCGLPEATPPPTPRPTPNNCLEPITFEYYQVRGPEQTLVSNQYKDSHGVLFRLDTTDLEFRQRFPMIAVTGNPDVAFRPADTPEYPGIVGKRFLTDRAGYTPFGTIYPILMTFSKPEFMSNQLEFDLIDPEETETYTFTGYQGTTQVFKQEWSKLGNENVGKVAHVVLKTEKPDQLIDRVIIEAIKRPAIGLGFAIDNIDACNSWGGPQR